LHHRNKNNGCAVIGPRTAKYATAASTLELAVVYFIVLASMDAEPQIRFL